MAAKAEGVFLGAIEFERYPSKGTPEEAKVLAIVSEQLIELLVRDIVDGIEQDIRRLELGVALQDVMAEYEYKDRIYLIAEMIREKKIRRQRV